MLNAANGPPRGPLKTRRKLPQRPAGRTAAGGRSTKKLQGDLGKIQVQTLRDRQATFEPQIVGKRQRRIEGFDDKILTLHAKGLTTRDIQDVVKELYDVDVSADLVSRVTEDLENDLKTWQTRSLQSVYPIVFLDGIVVNIRGGDARVSSLLACTWPRGSIWTAKRSFCGFGSPRTRGRSFGSTA